MRKIQIIFRTTKIFSIFLEVEGNFFRNFLNPKNKVFWGWEKCYQNRRFWYKRNSKNFTCFAFFEPQIKAGENLSKFINFDACKIFNFAAEKQSQRNWKFRGMQKHIGFCGCRTLFCKHQKSKIFDSFSCTENQRFSNVSIFAA